MSATHVASDQGVHETAGASPTLWRNADFLKFWSGETLSLFGSQVTNLAPPLTAVLVFHATSTEVGLLRFLQLVPYLGLAMVFGVWVDRARRKRVMFLANGARMVLIGLIPLLSSAHLSRGPVWAAAAVGRVREGMLGPDRHGLPATGASGRCRLLADHAQTALRRRPGRGTAETPRGAGAPRGRQHGACPQAPPRTPCRSRVRACSGQYP
jgi:hypothetical protein